MEREVQLEVFINNETTGVIVAFKYTPAGDVLRAQRGELRQAGVKVPGRGSDSEFVRIDTLGLVFNFDEVRQRILFTVREEERLAREYNAGTSRGHVKPAANPGLVVNYSVFAGSFKDSFSSGLAFSGANVSLDARAFSRFGVFRQTGIAGSTLYNNDTNYLRLESTYSYFHSGLMLTAEAGDIVSGGLKWSRPVRMGGIQVRRDFSLRAGYITKPIPVISGTAAVPSTVDVYVNGLRSFSRTVGSGPFQVSNLESLATDGSARVVVRDATGRAVEQTLNLNTSAFMLRPGLVDFSAEAGYARRSFGILSNDYDRRLTGSATVRYGFSTNITLEAHGEGGAGLINGGVGAVVRLGWFGTLQVASAMSRRANGGTGYQIYADWSRRFNLLTVNVSGQGTIGDYEDLASVTAKYQPLLLQKQQAIRGNISFLGGATATSLRPPRFLARASLSAPVMFDKGSVSANLIYSKTYEGVQSKIATVSYSRPLPYRGSLFLTAFADFGTNKNRGFYTGLSFPLGYGVNGNASVSRNSFGKLIASLEASKAQPMVDNTYGWRVRASREHNHVQQVAGSYRSSYGQISGQITRDGERLHGTATLDGSVAVIGGGVFAGNRVSSSFAVVSVGKPNVAVKQDHRVIGKTNMFGKLLVPNLRSFERNTIAIDPSNLPANFDATNLSMSVAPYRHSGVVIDFSGNMSSHAAIVVFRGADGKFLMTGSRGKMPSGEEFIIGYDGQAYIRGLSASNSVTIDLGSTDCKAQFGYAPQGDKQVLIDNVTCK